MILIVIIKERLHKLMDILIEACKFFKIKVTNKNLNVLICMKNEIVLC